MPADFLAEYAGDDLSEEAAGVDSHVEDRESCVASRTAFGVEVTDDRRDVRLEETGPEDDENESDEKRNLALRETGEADGYVAERDEHCAKEDRAAESEQSVGDPTAGE